MAFATNGDNNSACYKFVYCLLFIVNNDKLCGKVIKTKFDQNIV